MSRTWFITGASRGLGAAIAQAALAAGDSVVVSARRLEQLEQFVAQAPEQTLAVELDVTREDQAAAAVGVSRISYRARSL
nr:SDR family NAD(P)-dependent oxidoreductase [[Pseudomonas] sp. BICA1-14]